MIIIKLNSTCLFSVITERVLSDLFYLFIFFFPSRMEVKKKELGPNGLDYKIYNKTIY